MYRWLLIILLFGFSGKREDASSWIRINQLGYQPNGVKVAVFCSNEELVISNWELVDVISKKPVHTGKPGKAFGAYGPFKQTHRLNFSSYKKPGRYYLQAGGTKSPVFEIGGNVYNGTADFCLRYMRQQRTGFNPFLKDSCHTHDGYVLYGEKAGIKDSTHIDVVGGWHDASDYLQYSTTSANATYHLLMAYRDFPKVFTDEKLANGLDGKNKIADVLDEAKWGLDWLLKMHPKDDWMFNQIADDRDHQGMRIPKEDSFYGRGYERPVYFCSPTPQGFGKYKNRSTGLASTAGKFASAFALGYTLFRDPILLNRALSPYALAMKKPGVCQTALGRSPYFYEEDNVSDDMKLAASHINSIQKNKLQVARSFAARENVTPWLGADTARH